MPKLRLETERLSLQLESIEVSRARIDSLPAEFRSQISQDWLDRFYAATEPDAWIHGFAVTLRGEATPVGGCGFKGPPAAGMVEIAYNIEPAFENRGFATEAAAALCEYAWSQPGVDVVRAHTLPEENASTRVLTKCGFDRLGEVVDPEDGRVWRWERAKR